LAAGFFVVVVVFFAGALRVRGAGAAARRST